MATSPQCIVGSKIITMIIIAVKQWIKKMVGICHFTLMANKMVELLNSARNSILVFHFYKVKFKKKTEN